MQIIVCEKDSVTDSSETMAAALMVTDISTMEKALQSGALVNPRNISFGHSRDVQIKGYVYRIIEDESVKPEEIGLGGVARRELDLKIGDVAHVSPFAPTESDADQNVVSVTVEASRMGRVQDSRQGLVSSGYLAECFADIFGHRYLTVGQTFVLEPIKHLLLSMKVVSMTGAVFDSGRPVFYPAEPIAHGLCPKPDRIAVRNSPTSDRVVLCE